MKLAKLFAACVFGCFGLRPNFHFKRSRGPSIPTRRAVISICIRIRKLSTHEIQTAAKLAGRLRSLGYDVTEHVGGTGIVAILKNGAGPTVMLRTELDALPVEEKTGLSYASKSSR